MGVTIFKIFIWSYIIGYTFRNQFFMALLTCCHKTKIEPVHEISNNVTCATSKVSDQPAHMRSLIRAFAGRLGIL